MMHIYCLNVVCAILLCSAGFVSAQTISPAPTDDTQLWNEVQITAPLQKKVDLIFKGAFRLGRNLSHPVSESAAISIAYKATKFLTFETGYQYQAAQPYAGRKSYTNTLSFNGTVKFPLGKFTLSDRNQIERRFRNSRSDNTRYRNRLRVDYPLAIGKTKFNVFVSNEVFFDVSAKRWARNRVAVGANKKLNKRLIGELYYMRQNDSFSNPGDLHIIGTILRIQL